MELWPSLRVLLRRWYVVIPGLAATAAIAVLLAGQVKPTYAAEGTIVFLRPLDQAQAPVTAGNPWQTVDYSLNQFALLMGQAAASPAFQERVAASGGSTNFSVTTSANQAQGSPTNQTPTLTLSVVADTPEDAMASYEVLGKAVDQEVQDRQRAVGAAEPTWITAVDLTKPAGAKELVGSRMTVLIAVGLVGTLATFGLVFLLDGVLMARRRRRDGPDVEADEDDPVPLIYPERRNPGSVDADELTLDDLIEDWPTDPPAGPRRPAIAGDRGPRRGGRFGRAVGQ